MVRSLFSPAEALSPAPAGASQVAGATEKASQISDFRLGGRIFLVGPGDFQGRAFCVCWLLKAHQNVSLLKARSSQGAPLCFLMDQKTIGNICLECFSRQPFTMAWLWAMEIQHCTRSLFMYMVFILERVREEGRERKRRRHRFVVPLIDMFVGCYLYVP